MTALVCEWTLFQQAGRTLRPLRFPASFAPSLVLFFAAPARAELPIQKVMSDVDASDVARARGGNGEAYRRIVARHQVALAKRMRRFARGGADVEELVHETFVQAYMSLHTYSQRAPFEHWLASIATRVGYAYWKRRERAKKIGRLEDSPEVAAKEQAGSSEEAGALLHGVLEKLSPRDRLVITLLHLEERSVAEAAEHTGWSQTMVKVQAFRARARLKKLLQQRQRAEDPS